MPGKTKVAVIALVAAVSIAVLAPAAFAGPTDNLGRDSNRIVRRDALRVVNNARQQTGMLVEFAVDRTRHVVPSAGDTFNRTIPCAMNAFGGVLSTLPTGSGAIDHAVSAVPCTVDAVFGFVGALP